MVQDFGHQSGGEGVSGRGWIFGEMLECGLDERLEYRDIIAGGGENDVPVDTEIIVDNDVPHAADLPPGNLRMCISGGLSDAKRRLADDLDLAEDV